MGSVGCAADQKMRWETIAGSQIKDNLSYLDRVADLVPPIRLQCLGKCAHGRFIVRKQVRRVLVRTNAPVRSHPARFERAHFHAKRSHFLGKGLRKSSHGPLRRVVRRTAGPRQPSADRGYLENAAALLLSHDRYRRAAHVDDSIKISVNHRLEPLRTQLLKW